MKVLNAISLNMLAEGASGFKVKHELDPNQDLDYSELVSYIGHKDLCTMIKARYGITLPLNRCSNKLHKEEYVIVFQYKGPRLPEGATTLPEGASLKCLLVEVL